MKNVLKIVLIISLVLIMIGCADNKKDTDALKFKEEYEAYNGKSTSSGEYLSLDIPDDNIIKYSSLKEVNDILESGDGVIYLGFPKCPWCRNAVRVLLDASSSTSLDKIYYVNMQSERDTKKLDENGEVVTTENASSDYSALLENLDAILPDYILYDEENNEHNAGEKRVYVPLVLFVKDGELVDYHMDTVSSQTDPFISLTDDEYNELYNIYLKGIHKVLEDICDDGC